MQAVRLHEYDKDVDPGSLKVEEVEEPEITGPFDVIVRIGGAGLCRTDIHVVEGQWKPLVDPDGSLLPYTLGHENAGWVHEVGSAVPNVEVGDAVVVHPLITCGFCRPCRDGDDMHCENQIFPGITHNGGFADLLKTNARAVIKLPDGVQPADVAAHADAGLTAYHAVKKSQSVLYPGAKAVVIGAGGLGHIGIQSLKALTPAEVIVVDPLDEALSLAKEWGADYTVKVEASSSHVDTVLEITGGQGAEAILDFVGEKGATRDGFAMTKRAGKYYVIGYGENIDVPTIDVISTERSFIGNLVGSYNELAELMNLQARGLVTLHTSTYPLDAVGDAVADLDAGRLQGRGILIPQAS